MFPCFKERRGPVKNVPNAVVPQEQQRRPGDLLEEQHRYTPDSAVINDS